MTTNTKGSQDRTASIDLAQLDKLPTYDPERDTPGMMELRSEFNDGDYFKVEDVRALARRASATPSSKDAGGEPVAMVTGSDTVIGRESRGLQWVKGFSAFTLEPGTKLYAGPVHDAAAPSLPTNDEVYAEVNRQRDTVSNQRYVSSNAVNDVMAAVRVLSAGAAAKTDQAPGSIPEFPDNSASAAAARSEHDEPTAWIAYYDGVKSQNVARDRKEKADIESVAKVMGHISSLTWEELFSRAALARAPLPAEGENVAAANAGELDLDDLDNTAKEALRDLSHVENHLEQSDAPTKVKNRAVDVRLCIKELRAALKARAGAQDGQPVDDARDAAPEGDSANAERLGALKALYELAGEAGDNGNSWDADGWLVTTYNKVLAALGAEPYRAPAQGSDGQAMSASRPDDKGGAA